MTGLAQDVKGVAALQDSLKDNTDLTVLWVSTAKADASGAR